MLLAQKIGLVMGVANKRSIAWAITQAAVREGARVALTYQGERLYENVRELAGSVGTASLYPCDVTVDADLDRLFEALERDLGGLDFVVHSIAFAPRPELDGAFADTSREGFRVALDVSSYSLVGVARRAAALMEGRAGSILTLTYLGSERVATHYNVMGVAKAALESSVRYLAADLGPRGVRVNAISAGPIKTLAAAGIKGFSDMLAHHRQKAPLGRNTDPEEVADAAMFLVSRMSRGITGEVLFVDAGYNIMAV